MSLVGDYGDSSSEDEESRIPVVQNLKKKRIQIAAPKVNKNDSDSDSDDDPDVIKRSYSQNSSGGLSSLLPAPKHSFMGTSQSITSKTKTAPSSCKVNAPKPKTKHFVPNSLVNKRRKKTNASDDEQEDDDLDGSSFLAGLSSQPDRHPLITDDVSVTSPYPGEDDSVTAPYHEGGDDDDDAVTAPYPGGEDGVTEPYPGGDASHSYGQYSQRYHETNTIFEPTHSDDLRKLAGRSGAHKINIIELNEADRNEANREWMQKNGHIKANVPLNMSAGGKGVSKKKHQITYLAEQAKANQEALEEHWAKGRDKQKNGRSMYGF